MSVTLHRMLASVTHAVQSESFKKREILLLENLMQK